MSVDCVTRDQHSRHLPKNLKVVTEGRAEQETSFVICEGLPDPLGVNLWRKIKGLSADSRSQSSARAF